MKKITTLSLNLILFLYSSFCFAQYSLFDTEYLHEVRITSTNPNFWQQMDNDYQNWLNNGVEIPYQSTTVEIDGNTLEDVGIRQKGFSSNFFTDTAKKPLKLHFSKFVEDRKYDGVKKVNLMNGVGDPAIAKDKLAYNMFRMHGVPGPRVAHSKIYVNDVYWGIYALIEQVDKRFLKRNFADKSGNLWKNKGNSELLWGGEVETNYSFELQTNEDVNDWSKFYEFVDFINNSSDADFSTQFADIFELDEYLRILAIDILINNWDSYLSHGRNWYMYYEPKINKMHWIPWDYNFAFDRHSDGFNDLDLIQSESNKILTYRVFQVPEYKTRVLDYMCEILEVNFTSTRIEPFLTNQLNLVINDWTASNDFFTIENLNNFINGAVWNGAFGGIPSQGLKQFIIDRAVAVQNDLSSEGHTCSPLAASINPKDIVINELMSNNDDGSQWSDQDSENDDWVELYNNTNSEISLKNYFLSNDSTFIHKWEFPDDLTIPANGYLIVWTDKDPQQAGLHSKFSLDKDGGKLFLTYLDNTIIDSLSYNAQAKNISSSRVPNGIGTLYNVDVTFNSINVDLPDLIFSSGFEQL